MNTRINNFTLGLALLILVSFVCLPLSWGSFRIDNQEGMGSIFNGAVLTVTALNGTIAFLGFPLPMWFLVAMSSVGSVISILKIRSIIDIHKALVLCANVIAGIILFVALIAFGINGSIGIGLFVMFLVSAGSVFLTLRALRDPQHNHKYGRGQ